MRAFFSAGVGVCRVDTWRVGVGDVAAVGWLGRSDFFSVAGRRRGVCVDSTQGWVAVQVGLEFRDCYASGARRDRWFSWALWADDVERGACACSWARAWGGGVSSRHKVRATAREGRLRKVVVGVAREGYGFAAELPL